jgi:hypothetical protein
MEIDYKTLKEHRGKTVDEVLKLYGQSKENLKIKNETTVKELYSELKNLKCIKYNLKGQPEGYGFFIMLINDDDSLEIYEVYSARMSPGRMIQIQKITNNRKLEKEIKSKWVSDYNFEIKYKFESFSVDDFVNIKTNYENLQTLI